MEKNSYMMNPYVEQMEKFGKSLEHLADTFFRMEERKGQFTSGEVEEMFSRVSGAVCKNCENRSWCLGENQVRTKQLVYEILTFCCFSEKNCLFIISFFIAFRQKTKAPIIYLFLSLRQDA